MAGEARSRVGCRGRDAGAFTLRSPGVHRPTGGVVSTAAVPTNPTPPRRDVSPVVASLVGAVVSAVRLAGCAGEGGTATDPGPRPVPVPPAVSAPDDGAAYAVVPEPGRTLDASPGPTPPGLADLRLAVVVPDGSASSRRLLAATRSVAEAGGAALRVFTARAGVDPVGTALAAALGSGTDLVVGLGEGVVDVFGFETAQRLDQRFLVVGAQLAEPTANVTAVIWPGATGRGSAAAADDDRDPGAATERRVHDAVVAGLEAVRRGETGVVLRLSSQD